MYKLIRTIELLNEKSVVFGIDNSRSNLWILMHFKNLKIASKKIYYQINNGVHQRKNTIHPKRWLKKNFRNTAELLDYINKKSYDIHYLEIEFENGWRLKDRSINTVAKTHKPLVYLSKLHKKTLSFLKGLVVAGTGLEPVTFGL